LNEYGIVTATLPANVEADVPVLGLLAHIDTSPESPGAGVVPQVFENYDGKDIALDEEQILHVYNVHLGTALLERRHQAERLASIVHDRRVAGPKIVLGDFNEWARGLATDVLASRLQSVDIRQHIRRRWTYPGFFPILHLDHIYYEGHVEVMQVELPRTRQALVASDHLPLVANLRIGR
jgi:endonuclease/exonuclease/phosphatase family metal-dependent hydrolase